MHTDVNLRRQSKVLRRFLDVALAAIEKEARSVTDETWPSSHAILQHIVELSQRHAEKLRDWLS